MAHSVPVIADQVLSMVQIRMQTRAASQVLVAVPTLLQFMVQAVFAKSVLVKAMLVKAMMMEAMTVEAMP